MKTSYFALLILLSGAFFSSNATNYTNNGTSTSYSLNNKDTLRIVNGTYTGNLSSFNTGAVVIVSAGATFKPNYVNTPNGKIINYGITEFNSMGTHSNFTFENYNLLNVKGDLSLYNGSTQTWNNYPAATIKVRDNFSMNDAVFNNYSIMTVGGNFAMYDASSNFLNRGTLTISGDLSISNGILNNQNRIFLDDLNAWGGQVINEGSISPKGALTFSAGTNYTNKCLLVTNTGFTNYGTFTNNGMLWVGRTGNANSDHFYNSGTFTNNAGAVVKTIKFTNYSTLSGSGSYYINGESYNSGTVGRSGVTTDTIKVYDVTRSNSSRIFDTQWGTVHPNVVYRAFALPDTTEVNYTGCSPYYRSNLAAVLPVEWNYFDVKLVQAQPNITWSAQYEANMKFEVERSYDNSSFTIISTVGSNTSKTYSYTDGAVQKNTTVYYRIKATSVSGAVRYTETKTVRMAGTKASMAVYPNPVKDVASVQYTSEKNEQLIIRVSNISGQQLAMKNVTAVKGINTFSLTETAQLNAGVYFIEFINANSVIATERFVKN